MDKTTLIIIMILLLLLLLPLVSSLVFSGSSSKGKSKKAAPAASRSTRKKGPRTFDELRRIVRTRGSSTEALKEALNELLLHYGKIPDKLGSRGHPDFDYYRDVIFSACRHRNIDKDTLLAFDRGLRDKNPQYRKEIDEAVKGGLESRGI